MQVLDRHAACLIKKDYLCTYRINWDDKVNNIISIANELNLGLDSFVFVDDSKIECDLVTKYLPEVEVLQVPANLYLLPQLLAKNNMFDSLVKSNEDQSRTALYQQERVRRDEEKKFVNLDDYLDSLELKIKINTVNDNELSRIAQLTQKTNQFNLSTKRYTINDIKTMNEADHCKIYSLWASDKFGDYGLTGLFIAHNESTHVKLDSFLLSCRVLSRRIEHAFLAHCLRKLHLEWKLTKCHAYFLPTNRNNQVKNFLAAIGFNWIQKIDQNEVYELDGIPLTPKIDFIRIVTENHCES